MSENSGGGDGQQEAATAEALKQEENRTFLRSLNESQVLAANHSKFSDSV